MKTRNKGLILIVFFLMVAMIVAACGGSATTEETTTNAPEPTEAPAETPVEEPAAEPTEAPMEEPMEEPTEAPMEEPTEAPAEEPMGEPLKIGVMTDLSGALVLFGQEMLNGFELGLQYATDGTMTVNGRPIELIIRDDSSDVEAGSAAARELIESEGVELLVGNTSSAVALQVQQIADENEVLYFAAPAASPDITGANWNPHTFRICRNAAQDGLTMASWAVNNLGENYVILAEDYAFGQATAAGFQAAFGALGANFLTEEPIFAASDTSDFTPYIQQILDLNPDGLILVWASNTSGVVLYEQLNSQGVIGSVPIITGFSSNDLVRLLDPGNIGSIGLIVYHYTLPQTEANDWLVEQHLAQYDGYPDLFSECGFATAQAIVQALEETGGDTEASAMIPALEGMTFEGPKGTYTIRPEDHQALASLYIVKLVNVDDPNDAFFELVQEVSGEESAPPCTAPSCN
ncbi:MAG: substrate-binding domain-containing protein [Candidatus Promineifilaceae bacterium]